MGGESENKGLGVSTLKEAADNRGSTGKGERPLDVSSLAPLIEPDSIPPISRKLKDSKKGRDAEGKEKASGLGSRERALYRKVVAGLVTAVICLIIALLFLVGYLIRALENQSTHPGNQSTPAADNKNPLAKPARASLLPATTSSWLSLPPTALPPTPLIPLPQVPEALTEEEQIPESDGFLLAETLIANEKNRAKEEYEKSVQSLDRILRSIAGIGEGEEIKKGDYETIDKFYRRMLLAPEDPFNAAVLATSGLDWRSDVDRPIVSFENLYSVGIAAHGIAEGQMKIVREKSKALDKPPKNDLVTYRKWLTQWLLGTEGFYCQLRERFWFQDKSPDFDMGAEQKVRFGGIRQERRRAVVAAGYPKRYLYNYCDREIL